MSPPPEGRGKPPVTDDADSSEEGSRRRDDSFLTPDIEATDAHVGDDEGREEESLGTAQTGSTRSSSRNQPRARRLSRMLSRAFSGRQHENQDDVSVKREQHSPGADQDDSRQRTELPSVDPHPSAPELPSSTDHLFKRNKKKAFFSRGSRNDEIDAVVAANQLESATKGGAKEAYHRPEPSTSKVLDLAINGPGFSSKTSAEGKAESKSDVFKQPAKSSPSLARASHPNLSGPVSVKDVDSSASGAEYEVLHEPEDPSRRFQRIIVDRTMSSFMNWLDTKLRVKDEDESQEPEPPLPAAAPCAFISHEDSSLPPAPATVFGSTPYSSVSDLQPIRDAMVPARKRGRASRSALPPPPPPPSLSLPAPRPQTRFHQQVERDKALPRLARKQPPTPKAFMAAPSSVSTATSNIHTEAPPGGSPASHVVAAAAPLPRKRASRGAGEVQTRVKRSEKRGRPTDRNKEDEDEDDAGGGDGDDGNQPPRAKLSKVQEDGGNGAKLACPFFKHNPRKYKSQRPCCGPGWDHVHRIKEHIYRKHSLPKFSCPRCSQPFETQSDLQAHARSPDACEVREPEVLDGITQDQEKKLRSRKKTSATELTEAEKWTQIYVILFPDVREREIPSPYYNTKDAETNLGGYEDYLRRELPPLVRRQLEREVERELSFVEEGMKQKVIEIARNLQLSLFKGYQQLESQERGLGDPPSVNASSSRTDGSTSSAADTSPSTMTTAGTTPEIPDPLEIFGDQAIPDFDFDFLSEVPFPDEPQPPKEADLNFGFGQPSDTHQPITMQPGMEMLGGQQYSLPVYGLNGYHSDRGLLGDTETLNYVP